MRLSGLRRGVWRRGGRRCPKDCGTGCRPAWATSILVVPALVLTAFVAGAVIPWASPESFSSVLGNHVKGIAIAAGLGTLAGLPLVLIIPVTALLLLLGMGTVPAAVLLFLVGIGGLAAFRGLARSLPRKGLAAVAVATWAMGTVGGLAVWAVSSNRTI